MRQTIGQFLAVYSPETLAGGLRGVTVGHTDALAAEGRVILAWLRRRLTACGTAADVVRFTTAPLTAEAGGSLAVRFDYADNSKSFRWSGNLVSGQAAFEASLGAGRTRLAAAVSLLTPETALSEAMFF